MMRSRIKTLVMLLVGALLAAACATTQLNSVWKDPSYQARPGKFVVIGVAKNAQIRRLFEDEFVQQLKERGTDAVASYTFLPDTQQNDQKAVAAKVKELGADAVLVTRLVKKETVKVYVPGTTYVPPPYYGTWPAYYGYGYNIVQTPGYVAEDEYAVIETNLYETGNDKLVWTALSETLIGGSNQKLIKTYIDVMVKALAYDKFLDK